MPREGLELRLISTFFIVTEVTFLAQDEFKGKTIKSMNVMGGGFSKEVLKRSSSCSLSERSC